MICCTSLASVAWIGAPSRSAAGFVEVDAVAEADVDDDVADVGVAAGC
jgi:hypothetical protein